MPMARERYLVRVDPKELVYQPAPQEPMTPKKRWENFWYHHKWLVIGCGILVVTLTITIVQSVTRVKPDYFICLVTDRPMTSQADHLLEEALAASAKDRNNDGKIRVEVQCYNIAPGDAQSVNRLAVTNQQAVMSHIMARDVSLWALTPSYYGGTLNNALDDGAASFFIPLEAFVGQVEGLSADLTYWNWEGAPLLKQPGLETAQQQLYWGVRVVSPDASDKIKQETQDALELLLAFAKQQKPVDSVA